LALINSFKIFLRFVTAAKTKNKKQTNVKKNAKFLFHDFQRSNMIVQSNV